MEGGGCVLMKHVSMGISSSSRAHEKHFKRFFTILLAIVGTIFLLLCYNENRNSSTLRYNQHKSIYSEIESMKTQR